MSKKEIEQLEKRIDRIEKCLELLEMETKELKSVDPGIIEERFKSIEETLYSTKEILSMKDVCHYLDISQSMLYKLTCNGEIPHFKPRGKTIFFEKKELIKWIKKKGRKDLPDSRLVELLDRCAISVKDIKVRTKKKDQNGKKN